MSEKEIIVIDDVQYLVSSITEDGAGAIRAINDAREQIRLLKAQHGLYEIAMKAAAAILNSEKDKFTKV